MNTKNISSANDTDEDGDSIKEMWKFTEKRWNLPHPQLILSVLCDNEPFFMNQRLLKSILVDLVKAAAAAKGKHFC